MRSLLPIPNKIDSIPIILSTQNSPPRAPQKKSLPISLTQKKVAMLSIFIPHQLVLPSLLSPSPNPNFKGEGRPFYFILFLKKQSNREK